MWLPGARRGTWIVPAAIGLALLGGWQRPVAAGDLRPSPDAVEYGLAAADLARFQAPAIRIGDVAVPPRYPPGLPLLAAPLVRLAALGGTPRPYYAVLASLAAGAVTVGLCTLLALRVFGPAAAVLAGALVVLSPFYQQFSRLVMAELPSAALFAGLGAGAVWLAGGAPRVDEAGGAAGRARGAKAAGLGLLLALAIAVRLANVHAAVPLALALATAFPRRRARLRLGLALGAACAAGLLPLLAWQQLTLGSPWRTGYHLWTPEWTDGSQAVFALRYALQRPALPVGATQGNLAYYLSTWVGLPARGDAGAPVPSPVHPSLAAVVAVAALAGALAAVRSRPGRVLVAYVAGGLLASLAFYGLYFYQDARFAGCWAPLWLTLAAGGLTLPLSWLTRRNTPPPAGRRWAMVAAGIVAAGAGLLLLAGAPDQVGKWPVWAQLWRGEPVAPPPRLAQARALAAEAPDDAWLVSAIDGPLLDSYVLRGSHRRYVPLARGLEFVDKPPLRGILTAEELRPAIAQRVAAGTAGAVVLDRWTVEFAEAYPDFGTVMERVLQGFDLQPGGSGAPASASFYFLAPAAADHGLARFALRDGDGLRGSGEAVYVYERGLKRHVPSPDALAARGVRWEQVRRLPDRVLRAIPDGPPLPDGA